METILINPNEDREIIDFRRRGFTDIQVLGRYCYRRAGLPLENHSHGSMVEICYLSDGRQVYVSHGETFTLQGGDVFIVRPHEIHGTGDSPEGRGTLYWLLIEQPGAEGHWLGLEPADAGLFWQRLVAMSNRCFHVGLQLRDELEKVFAVHRRTDDPLDNAKIRAGIFLALCELLEVGDRGDATVSPPIQRAIQRMRQAVASTETGGARPSVLELARAVNLSTSRFKVRFKEETGLTPCDYQMRLIVDHARRLLEETDISITDLAMRLGFSSSQYFATVFRRYTGVAPSRYRE